MAEAASGRVPMIQRSDRPQWTASHRGHVSDLPEFGKPPVAEVALGVQFRQLYGMRAIELSELRTRWAHEYPVVEEQPPLAPVIEGPTGGPTTVQFVLGPPLMSRLWFLSEDRSSLVQLQPDRLVVNWRGLATGSVYPRYPQVRKVFERRWSDVAQFVGERQLGSLEITQCELNYINVIDWPPDEFGHLELLLRNWREDGAHHLGAPQQVRIAMVFDVADLGRPPVRMHVSADPAQRPDGTQTLFLTITVRGAPASATFENAMEFLDGAHDHLVRSFAELTAETMHAKWERRR